MRTKDFITTDWMQWFAIGDSKFCIFRLDDGRRCVTDGKILVATNQDGPTEVRTDNQEIVRKSPKLLDEPITNVLVFDRRRMLNIFGEAEYASPTTCEKCSGDGEVDHRCNCDFCQVKKEKCENCDGSGNYNEDPEKRFCTLWGVPFDANLIAYVVACCPKSDEYKIGLTSNDKLKTVHIITNSWHALVVQLDERVKREHEYPELMAKE